MALAGCHLPADVWSRRLCQWLGVRASSVSGTPPAGRARCSWPTQSPALVMVLAAVWSDALFLAKSGGGWLAAVHWLCQRCPARPSSAEGRGRRRRRLLNWFLAVAARCRRLHAGGIPEGTSTDGRGVPPFPCQRLLQARPSARMMPAQALALRHPVGGWRTHPAVPFIGDDELLAHPGVAARQSGVSEAEGDELPRAAAPAGIGRDAAGLAQPRRSPRGAGLARRSVAPARAIIEVRSLARRRRRASRAAVARRVRLAGSHSGAPAGNGGAPPFGRLTTTAQRATAARRWRAHPASRSVADHGAEGAHLLLHQRRLFAVRIHRVKVDHLGPLLARPALAARAACSQVPAVGVD